MMPQAFKERQDTIITKRVIAGAQHGEDTAMRDKPISVYSSRTPVTERDVEATGHAGQRIAGVVIWRNY